MLPGWHPVAQAGLGTLFTWGLTAAGSALVFIFSSGQRRILDGSLGFAAGVMTAASYWSLLAPAIEMAEDSGLYGAKGQWAFVPVAIGFTLGALFVYGADILMPYLGISNPTTAFALELGPKVDKDGSGIFDTDNMQHEPSTDNNFIGSAEPARQAGSSVVTTNPSEASTNPSQRRRPTAQSDTAGSAPGDHHSANNILLDTATTAETSSERSRVSWKRIMLLIIAITIHNIPEGLAVGVGFGAIGKTASATFEKARNLAIGIGIQNFPEGLAVSLPLRGAGMSVWKSFWYGQLSGMVEPVAGLLGALAVVVAEPVLPYALAFAAGAMIYVVVDDIVPEAQTSGNGTLASWGAVLGFVVMMSLDVGLG